MTIYVLLDVSDCGNTLDQFFFIEIHVVCTKRHNKKWHALNTVKPHYYGHWGPKESE